MAATTLEVGSEAWWQSKKDPEWEREDNGNYRAIFWWRDPRGTEKESAIRRVWVYITDVTDHHQNVIPQSMRCIDGTNVWCWSISLNANQRGSYCFIPTARNDILSSLAADATPGRSILHEGRRQLLLQAIADPLNPQSWQGGHGHVVSALEIPEAPVQSEWD